MERAQGFAEQGARVVWTAGIASTTLVQESAPYAIIRVYLTGTTQLATIYSDNQLPPTPMGNPFTANENGYWFFYAADGRYDVMIEATDWIWTIGDLLLEDPFRWTADQNANGHCLNDLGCLTFRNASCPAGARIWLNDSCLLQTSVGLETSCVKFSNGGPAMWLCAGADGTLHIRDTNGNDVGSITQGGLFDIYKLVAQQIEATQSIWSLGQLGGPCLQLASGGPSMFLCVDAAGTLHIRDTGGNDIGSITQGGLFDIYKLVAQQIEGLQSIYSLGTLGSAGDIATHGNIYADGCVNAACLNVSGNATILGSLNAGSVLVNGHPAVTISNQDVAVEPGGVQNRAFNTVYQNPWPTPMFVVVCCNLGPLDGVGAFCDANNPPGTAVGSILSESNDFTLIMPLVFWVLPGYFYRLDTSQSQNPQSPPIINTWVEWH